MTLYEWISIGFDILIIFGIYLAYRQFVEARKANKVQVLLKLQEEWRNPEIYKAVAYIHGLRTEWKKYPTNKWDILAEKWVKKTFQKDTEKWLARRIASQFLAKMGYLVQTGHLTPDELFGVVPEAGRLLIVLMPLDIAIMKFMTQRQGEPITEWDRPFGKWEFNFLWEAYKKWYKKNHKNYELKITEWHKSI